MAEQTFEVFSGNEQFTGVRAGVVFHEGKGQATKSVAQHLVADLGYTCPALFPEKAPQLSDIKGLGPVSVDKLAEAEVTTLEDLIGANIEGLAEATKIVQGTLEDWRKQAADLVEG